MNFIDYLEWRGDLTFSQSPFCEVDNMLLCYMVYVNLDGIAPGPGKGSRTLEDISQQFFQTYSAEELEKDRSFIRLAPEVMKAMAKTQRFKNVRIQNYVNKINLDITLQFAAMEALLDDGTAFVAYRGTDDTIVGWKEDFYLSKGEVPAEREALSYLNMVGEHLQRPLRVGGHSKGGNLAIYAAAKCDPKIQDGILEIYNNDGPGFTKEFLESDGLKRVQSKIRRYVPESSVIGMLLEHVVEPIVLKSSQKGVMQHDGFSWEVLGARFIHCDNLSNSSIVLNDILDRWLEGLKPEIRDQVIDDLFAILEAPGVKTLTELQEGGLKSAKAMLREIDKMDEEAKEVLQLLFKEMLQHIPRFLGI